MREAEMKRKTKETDIRLFLSLDDYEESDIETGVGFLDHMLTLFANHGRFALMVACNGDTHVDAHHTMEDIGIVLGQAFSEALDDKRGIVRYGSFLLPMDEALVQTAVDISGRGMLVWNVVFPTEKVGTLDTELFEEFFIAFARSAGITLHIRMLDGKNSHHIAEAIFKGVARALAEAVRIDPKRGHEIPSTKGIIE